MRNWNLTDAKIQTDVPVPFLRFDRGDPHSESSETLAVAVESAIRQKPNRIEVIVVDDCGKIPANVISHLAVRSIRLEKKSGPAAARNAGLAVANGKWVTFWDDDAAGLEMRHPSQSRDQHSFIAV